MSGLPHDPSLPHDPMIIMSGLKDMIISKLQVVYGPPIRSIYSKYDVTCWKENDTYYARAIAYEGSEQTRTHTLHRSLLAEGESETGFFGALGALEKMWSIIMEDEKVKAEKRNEIPG